MNHVKKWDEGKLLSSFNCHACQPKRQQFKNTKAAVILLSFLLLALTLGGVIIGVMNAGEANEVLEAAKKNEVPDFSELI